MFYHLSSFFSWSEIMDVRCAQVVEYYSQHSIRLHISSREQCSKASARCRINSLVERDDEGRQYYCFDNNNNKNISLVALRKIRPPAEFILCALRNAFVSLFFISACILQCLVMSVHIFIVQYFFSSSCGCRSIF